MKALLLLGLATLVRCIYDCEVFEKQCQDSCGADSTLSFSCQSNASPGIQTGIIVTSIVEESRAKHGGSHSCSCDKLSLESCFEYTQFCEAECGGSNFIEFFTCDLERLPQDSLFSAQSKLNLECQCVDGARGDSSQIKQAPSGSKSEEAVNLMTISYNMSYDPAKAAPSTTQIVSAIMQQQQQKSGDNNNNNNCFDYLPVSEGTCEDRIAWGSCAESWMSEKYYCAKSCGLCDQPESAQYDCFTEYNSCSQVCDGSFEFACYRQLKKTDCQCTQQGTGSITQQKELQVDGSVGVPPMISGVNVIGGECFDFLPADEGTCASRVTWNSCQEAWMKEKNYCAKSCGFCQTSSTPIIVSTQSEEEEWISAHNQFRQKHCVADLIWNLNLAIEAQKMADQCGMVDNDQHSWNFFRSVSRQEQTTPFKIVSSWYEIGVQNGLNFDAPAFTKQIAPTSKVIWKSSREVGCGKKECGKKVHAYCLYDPPGNILDSFETQVMPVCQ